LNNVPAGYVGAVGHGVGSSVASNVTCDAESFGDEGSEIDVDVEALGGVCLPGEEWVLGLCVVYLEENAEDGDACGADEVAVVVVVAVDLHLEIVLGAVDQVLRWVVETNLVGVPVDGSVVGVTYRLGGIKPGPARGLIVLKHVHPVVEPRKCRVTSLERWKE
jgi:hypothetical protein